nr:hypothetical protein [Tanacetum cinerariifolium]
QVEGGGIAGGGGGVEGYGVAREGDGPHGAIRGVAIGIYLLQTVIDGGGALAPGFAVEVAVGVSGGSAALARHRAEGGKGGAIERALHYEVVVVDFRSGLPSAESSEAGGLRLKGR